VRPIVLNMFGLVVASFTGSLPKGIRAGRLLSGYVERSLRSRATRGLAVDVLRPLVTDVGTKRALTTEQIAEEAGIAPLVARGCLIPLANDGLVRRLHGTPEKWEVAHDFVARLLQPLLRSWRRSAWERGRPYLAPIPLAVWLLAMFGLIVFYPALHDEYVLSKLRGVGLVPGPPADAGLTFNQNGTPIKDVVHFWQVVSKLQDLSTPVVGLRVSGVVGLISLQGMPALPALMTLDFNSDRSLTNLQGVPALPALTTLDLTLTELVSLQGMPALPTLRTLVLRATSIRGLQDMPTLPALTKLDLGYTIVALQEMPALPALTTLDLSYNEPLTSLQGMPALPLLAELCLEGSAITDLSVLPQLPALVKIRIKEGQIDPTTTTPEIWAKLDASKSD
jgi:hypothetical protein